MSVRRECALRAGQCSAEDSLVCGARSPPRDPVLRPRTSLARLAAASSIRRSIVGSMLASSAGEASASQPLQISCRMAGEAETAAQVPHLAAPLDQVAGDFVALEALPLAHRLGALEARRALDRPVRAGVGRAVLLCLAEYEVLDELRCLLT